MSQPDLLPVGESWSSGRAVLDGVHDAGVASLEAHADYLRGLGDGGTADPREFLESMARPAGARLGHLRRRVRGHRAVHTELALC